ncbi:hypothetical protein Cni_G19073 [Canna indica]|uniref:Uncharacterized protein n=1 Tax=Canna indica TaxID=4628 RepID=A0AAQ3QIB4_9LILI|nr:hypothetical protein Cni_G19073 [Canna indica]
MPRNNKRIKGDDFALVSNDKFHINVHFIDTWSEGKACNFTRVQALSIMFDSHTLVVAARKVATWDYRFDALAICWDQTELVVPTDSEVEWRTRGGGGDDRGDEKH